MLRTADDKLQGEALRGPSDTPSPESRSILDVLAVLAVTLVLQAIILPSLYPSDAIKMHFVIVVDVLGFARMIAGVLRKEKGRWFSFYSVILLTSAFWIEMISWVSG